MKAPCILLVLVSLKLGLACTYAVDPYEVEGLVSSSTWQIINDGDLVPDQTVTNFGSVQVSNSTIRQYRITNLTTDPVTISSVSITSGSRDFFPSMEVPVTLERRGITTFTVGFHPSSVGIKEAVLTINTNSSNVFQDFDFAITGEGLASPIYVDSSASGTNDGSSWANAFNYLQDGLADAGDGDCVLVAAGVYYPDEGIGQTDNDRESTFAVASGVTVSGGYPPGGGLFNPIANPAILSGDLQQNDLNLDGNHIAEDPRLLAGSQAFHVVTSATGDNGLTTLSGLIITAGSASELATAGAGVGGGIYLDGRQSLILNYCQIIGNLAETFGGGIYSRSISSNSDLTISNCVVSQNAVVRGGNGGGCYSTIGSLCIENSVFRDNLTPPQSPPSVTNGVDGTALYCLSNRAVTLSNCEFSGHQGDSTRGSALHYRDVDTISIDRSQFFNNDSGSSSFTGCLTIDGVQTVTVGNSLFYGNRGAAIRLDGSFTNRSITLLNTTIAANDGVSVGLAPVSSFTGVLAIGNCVLAGNSDGFDSDVSTFLSVVRSHSIVEGFPADGDGNLDGSTPPDFLDPQTSNLAPTALGNYRLTAGSPLIDTGLNASNSTTRDLDGLTRVLDGDGNSSEVIDIGAYEFDLSSAPPPGVAITGIAYNPANGQITLTVECSATTTFSAQQSPDLKSESWTSTTTGSLSPGSNSVLINGSAYDWPQSRNFFRIATP